MRRSRVAEAEWWQGGLGLGFDRFFFKLRLLLEEEDIAIGEERS